MNHLNKIIKNDFFRDVLTLAFGTIVSQIIVVGFSPLLTRVYNVEAFGVLSLFTSFTVIFGVITTARYELAIGLPKNDENAKNLIKLIAIIGFGISIFYLLVLILAKEILQVTFFSRLFANKWIYLAPVYTFFIAIYSGLIYWNQRFKNYKKITFANALQVVSTTLFSIILGLAGVIEAGMMISLVLGIVCSSVFLLKDFKKEDFKFHINSIKNVGKEYCSFPKYMILSDLSLTISQQYIPIIFAGLFSSTIVGYFALANRIIRLPNIVLTNSIGNVFRNDAIDAIRAEGNCKQLYISTVRKLAYMSFPIYTVMFIFSPTLFTFFFGEKWLIAGNFARILSVILMIEFVAIPLNSLFYIFEKQKTLMNLQVINTITGALMIFLGYKFFNNVYLSLILFCVNAVVFNLILIFYTNKLSKQTNS